MCDEGFLLSGTECVPKAQCGCSYNGAYIESGASFFTDHCDEKCTCNSTTKLVDCVKPGCHQGYQCKAVNGLIGCHLVEYAECSMTGGPHIQTFDGQNYDFHGTCVYQLAGVCSKDPSLPTFEVDVQNDAYGNRVGAGAKLVEVKVDGNSIVATRTQKGTVLVRYVVVVQQQQQHLCLFSRSVEINTDVLQINGELTNVPFELKGKVTVRQISDSVEIKTAFGLLVSYDRQSEVRVKVPSTYAAATCGLCGNYSHKPIAVSEEELGTRWRVAEIPGCVDGCKNKSDCPSCDITQKKIYETDKYCGLIRKPTGPFRECHAIKNPESIFDNCVYDVCLYDGKKDSWCSYLRSYTLECQRRGINVSQWRTADFCPPSKGHNSQYEHCGDVCQATCDTGLPPVDCRRPCEEAWVCDDGFLLSGSSCVPLDQCGCRHEGKYYRKGEGFLSPDCRQSCICNGTVGFLYVLYDVVLPYRTCFSRSEHVVALGAVQTTFVRTVREMCAAQTRPLVPTDEKRNLQHLGRSTLQRLQQPEI